MASFYAKNNKLYLSIYHKEQRIIKPTGLDDNAKNRKLVKNDLLPNVLFQIQTGQIDISPKGEVKTVKDYAELFLKSKRVLVKESTYIRYESIINNQILPTFGKRAIDSIKLSEIKRWFNYWIEERSSATAIYIANTFSAIFQEAFYDEAIEKNPFQYIKRPKKVQGEAQPFEKEVMLQIIQSASGWFQNFLALSFFTGLRTGEAVALKWSDVDFNSQELEVKRSRRYGKDITPKTQKSVRTVPIFDELLPYLESQRELTKDSESEYVFLTRLGTPFNDGNRIRDFHWKKLLKELKLPYQRLYDTRSTFATMMLSSGKFSINQVAQMMGHTNIEMLIHKYNKFIPSEVKKIDKSIGIL
ncbi:tyrosine-type recombinase/integrase [Sulfurimonas marina]|uniref:Site-specific integrase n=1 Tax=Sulfurimonas marina TaxID=2590551 RepID=A0A7M1AXJ0_9BACT|nr:site-specific integrase [Sulfurimonas marina]QOP42144.1 site-specific integrase [Sulfurimonas marina]